MIPRRWVRVSPADWKDIEDRLAACAAREVAIEEWEAAIARFTGMPYAAAVSSGRQGMLGILEYLGIGPAQEVIVPAYTLGELLPLIQRLGAGVAPADIDPGTFNVTADTIAARISSRTRAILVLHAFGAPANIPPILELAASRHIPVIEDCAHSLGATLSGRQTGSFGAAGFFSFETTKPVNTWGGGMVVTSDAALAEFVRAKHRAGTISTDFLRAKLRGVRMEQRLFRTGIARVPLLVLALPGLQTVIPRLYRRVQRATPQSLRYLPLQAEIGLEKLPALEERIDARNRLAMAYREALRPEIRTQALLPEARSAWYFYVIKLPTPVRWPRLQLLLKGIDAGIESEIADDCAALLGRQDCPHARELYAHALALPMHDQLTLDQAGRVAETLNRLLTVAGGKRTRLPRR